MKDELLKAIYSAARMLNKAAVEQINSVLSRAPSDMPAREVALRAVEQLNPPEIRNSVREIFEIWQREIDTVSAEGLGASLVAAQWAIEAERLRTKFELVWTGPKPKRSSLRRSDIVLEELISSVRTEILISSFVVVDIRGIVEQLDMAIDRGVSVTLVLETLTDKMSIESMKSLSDKIRSGAGIFEWPLEIRERDELGRYGSLHAKCAVADGEVVLISSANLTRHALGMNMEMGVLVRNRSFARDVKAHFDSLIKDSVLRTVGM